MVVSIEQFEVALSTNDVDTLLEAISEGSERFIDQVLASDRKYFHLLCERGHANVVELVLTRRCVDLEQDWQQVGCLFVCLFVCWLIDLLLIYLFNDLLIKNRSR